MTIADLPLCRHLVTESGWNQLDADWLRALALEPDGCFVVEVNGEGVATATTARFENIAWIAMVLVDKKMRGQGIAKQLLQHTISYLRNLNVKTIRLDATALGQGLYEKLGFQGEYEVVRFAGILNVDLHFDQHIHELKSSISIRDFDFEITETAREELLQHLIDEAEKPFFYSTENKKIIGYAGYREGRNAVQIGPVIAVNPVAGNVLLNAIAAHFPGQNAFLDIPLDNKPAIDWAENNGFTEQRRFLRMYLGDKVNDQPESIWASFGPEKG
ncbi:GNAT family N-acetyltransferase [Dyadobacter luticola]|nr:GNAT family N-acetyltransferase [Dyadobacter luticola]